jgi:arylsulfatase A-like enzyme
MRSKRRNLILGGTAVLLGVQTALPWAAESLPKDPSPFKGVVDVSRDKSTPDWPKAVKAPAGAPNVVVVLLDDVGYGAASVFGGPIETPELDRLASGGLRYNSFHVNSLCSPTRASLLSGRNSHQLGFGTVIEGASGYPGYNATWPKTAASVAEVLKQNGYSTAAFGKWHNTPGWETSDNGPFERWPTGLGFEYWYGFQGGQDNQYQPRLFRNTVAVEPSKTPAQGYHVTSDLADDAIRWLHQHDAITPDKPFFLYFATGAIHTPHHVPPEWIAKYKGRFDQGWDKLREETFARQKQLGIIPASAELTPRPAELPAWDSLTPDQQKLLAREAEVAAAFLAHTDHEVGRVLESIRKEGKFDNTLVFYVVGDNGSSAEGGLEGLDKRTPRGRSDTIANRLPNIDKLGSDELFNHYAAAWAWGLDTPFQWTKQVASHLGGSTDPLIVSWPSRIKDKGAVRGQYQHVTDIVPTIYEAAGIQVPDEVNGVRQIPIEGKSLAYTFDDPKVPTTHRIQYNELLGNRSIYKDGWWAGIRYLLPWQSQLDEKPNDDVNFRSWELYNLNEDFSQAHDLSALYPEKLKELQALFDSEARRNQVYPLAPRRLPQPSPADGRKSFTYREGVSRVSQRTAPDLAGKSHSILADVEVPEGGGNGVLIAEGGRFGGFTLYIKDGYVVYDTSAYGNPQGRLVANRPLAPGRHRILLDFKADDTNAITDVYPGRTLRGGVATLSTNGTPLGEARIALLGGFYTETLDVGQDLGTAVNDDYPVPYSFNGKLDTVTVELK